MITDTECFIQNVTQKLIVTVNSFEHTKIIYGISVWDPGRVSLTVKIYSCLIVY